MFASKKVRVLLERQNDLLKNQQATIKDLQQRNDEAFEGMVEVARMIVEDHEAGAISQELLELAQEAIKFSEERNGRQDSSKN